MFDLLFRLGMLPAQQCVTRRVGNFLLQWLLFRVLRLALCCAIVQVCCKFVFCEVDARGFM